MFNGNLYIKAPSAQDKWTRPSDWLPMPSVESTDDTFVGLHAIFPNGNNFVAFNFTTSTGNYQVDWGDGTITTHASNTTAEYTYDYSTYDVGNLTLTSRGYKQAIIVVTPLTGNLLTVNFNFRRTTIPEQITSYSSGFLDCILSMPNASSGSSISFGSSGSVLVHRYVERFEMLNIGGCTSMSNMFRGCTSLQSIALSNTGSVNSTANMFTNCSSIQTIPLFDTSSVTNMSSMFTVCSSIKTVPLFNTSNVTTMNQMFGSCSSLQSVPLFNTINVTNMSFMFSNCSSIKTVPLFNTANVTTMSKMFENCTSLQSVPLFNTANVTTVDTMFSSCVSIQAVPLFNTTALTASGSFNFATGCTSLDRIEMSFAGSVSMSSCQLSKTALEEIFNNLRRVTTAQTITITGNWGTSPLVAARTYTTTTNSNIITTSNTASLEPGMEVAGTNSPLTTPVAVTFQDAGDTVTLTSHGLEDNDEVSFATITSTTGILTNTIYYIVNKTIDTFQISTSVGGSPISLTVDGSGTMRYRSEIVSIVPNTSITMSRPMRFTGTPSLTFRQLKQSTALHKGWTVSG